jgi:hypothetical protein
MAAAKQNGRISLDYPFAAPPHAMITDQRLSPPAFRLWCILYMMTWTHEDPATRIIQGHLGHGSAAPTRRSIYRWLAELEACGWLDWQRMPGKAGANDRFTLLTRSASQPVIVESQPMSQPVIVESQDAQPVIVESQPVIVESQVVIVESQVGAFSMPPEQPNEAPKIYKDLIRSSSSSRSESVSDDDDDFFKELRRRGVSNKKSRQIAAQGLDMARVLSLLDNRPNPKDPHALGRLLNDITDGVLDQYTPPKAPLAATRANIAENPIPVSAILAMRRSNATSRATAESGGRARDTGSAPDQS